LDLGIALRGTTPLPEITTSFDIFGDLQPIDGEGHLVFNALGNVVTDGTAAPDRSDLLYGDASNNRIVAGGGADGANGRGGDDILVGQGGSDVEFGEQGNDLLFAGLEVSVQDAIASSSSGNSGGDGGGNQTFGLLSAAVLAGDNLSGPIRGDFLDGGEGDDQLIGDIGDDNLKGGAGSDLIVGGAGDDVIFGDGYVVGSVSLNWQVERTTTTFTDGRATRYEITETGITEGELGPEAGGADVIVAGAGKDWIFANGGDDLVDAGAGDDVVFGGAGNETISGGDGNDDLSGDQIDSGEATGSLSGALHGNDYINGGAGDDRIFGNGGADVLLGGDGDDTITGDDDVTSGVYHGDDFIDGGNGNDVLVGQGGADSLDGGAGDDQLQGDSALLDGQFHGNDYLSGGDGNDVIFGQGGADTLDGGAGDDILQGDSTTLDGRYHGADALDGGDGNDQLIGQGGADALRGGAGDDLLFGDAGSSGGLAAVYEGNDFLDGGAGKDQLVGGGGNDTLLGGSGDDNLIGDQNGDTSVETANDGADYLDGGDGDDYLIGQGGNDTLLGGADADTLRGGSGDDYLDGGTGNDVLEGGAGNDVYFFGRGSGQDTVYNTSSSGGVDEVEIGSDVGPDDLILARSGNYLVALIAGTSDALVLADFFAGDDVAADAVSAIQFGDGTRWDQAAIKAKLLQGSDSDDVLTGFSGADTLRGGDGNDQLLGGAGDDSLFGDAGNDVLDGGAGNDHLEGGLGSDIYQFGRGSGQDTIDNFTENDPAVGRQDTILLGAGIATTDVVTVRSGDDLILTINGTSDKLTVSGYFSADATTASAVDAIQFANGTLWTINTLKSRVLSGTTGNDTITGYATEDTLYGGNGDDVLDGADGRDYLYGGNGNDVLSGGSGSDYLSGEGGSDTYLFGRGSGQDIIYNYDESIGHQDIIQFAADVNAGDVVLVRSNNDLLLTISGTTDTLLVQNYFIGDGVGGFAVDAIRFADGTSWDIDTVKYKVLQGTAGNDVLLAYAAGSVVNGNDGNDYLYGNNGADTLNGGTGNDFLFGRTGDDVLHGDAGNDYLQGDGGNDTYLFGRSSGQDTIYNYDKTIGRQDAIQFAANINPSDIVLTRSGNDLLLAISGTTDTLLVQGYFNGDGAGGYAVDEIRFADGTNWSIDNVKEKLLQGTEGNDYLYAYTAGSIVSGRGGNDTLIGNNGNDILYGDAGNDTLYGGAGNDVLDGGSGFDVLRGEAGNDIYLFGRNYGQARIDNYDATVGRQDVVRFSSDVTADDVIASRSNTDLVLTITGTSDTLTVINYFQSDNFNAYAVNEIQFADGTTWSFDTIQTKVLIATEGNDNLYALTTGGVLSGLGGNDYLIGNIGSDTFYGNDGNDSLYGGSGNDVLYGGSGNDTLNAGDGVDVLDGGAGNDYLLGGIGNNTFLFGRGSGYDTINDARTTSGAFDIIKFSTDVAPGDVGIFRSGDSLVVSIVGTDDKIEIYNYFRQDNFGNYYYHTIDAIKFSDGTIWNTGDVSTINAQAGRLIQGTANADYLIGSNSSDLIYGNGGSDNLYGGAGNDTLDGGAGNDYLRGDAGNDTYLFGRGSGQDTISNFDATAGRQDVIRFAADVLPNDIVLTRSYDDLILAITGTTDTLRIQSYFNGDGAGGYTIDAIQFGDGTAWNYGAVSDILANGGSVQAVAVGVPSSPTLATAAPTSSISVAETGDALAESRLRTQPVGETPPIINPTRYDDDTADSALPSTPSLSVDIGLGARLNGALPKHVGETPPIINPTRYDGDTNDSTLPTTPSLSIDIGLGARLNGELPKHVGETPPIINRPATSGEILLDLGATTEILRYVTPEALDRAAEGYSIGTETPIRRTEQGGGRWAILDPAVLRIDAQRRPDIKVDNWAATHAGLDRYLAQTGDAVLGDDRGDVHGGTSSAIGGASGNDLNTNHSAGGLQRKLNAALGQAAL
jgi:Ca2+-binding RTX toxin-like protein